VHGTGRFTKYARLAVALACFVVFAFAAAALRQDKADHFPVEEQGPIPAALSHVLYGAPIGLVDSGLLKYFMAFPGKSAAEAVDAAVRGDVAPTHEWRMSMDGSGIGPPLEMTLAFMLFGVHARSILWLFLALLGLSACCYVIRFRRERLWVAPVFLGGLTLWLLTMGGGGPLSSDAAPLGGMRSYILIAILPVVHWCFELVADKSMSRREAVTRGALLATQVAIFGFAILVRNSPIALILAVIVGALLAVRYGLAKRAALLSLLPLAAMLACLFGLVPLSFPDQMKSGRLHSVVWHRALVSLSINPDWPFPGLQDRYECPLIKAGLGHPGADSIGHCVWFAASMNQSRPIGEVAADLYGADYERAARNAFFDISTHYPFETLKTFLYYKPSWMFYEIRIALAWWPQAPHDVVALAVVQMLLLAVFLAMVPAPDRGTKPRAGKMIAAAVVLSALIPHLIAWTNPPTGQELSAGVICGAIVALWLGCRVMMWGIGGRKHRAEARAPKVVRVDTL
jgi:hypothetical protein